MNVMRASAYTWRRARAWRRGSPAPAQRAAAFASLTNVGGPANTSADLRVCVLGAGVIGLTTAVRLAREVPGARVTVLADRFGGDTTTSGAAGIWSPYKLSDTPTEDVRRWSAATYDHLLELWHSRDAAAAGVSVVHAATLNQAPEPDPFYADIVQGFHRLPASQLHRYSAGLAAPTPPGEGAAGAAPSTAAAAFVDGWGYLAPVCEGRLYCRWLTRLLAAAGGCVVQRRVSAVADLAGEGFHAVVDCAGLEAGRLCGDEANCYPIRGQVMRVRAPWVTQAVFGHMQGGGSFHYYIIPNRECVVLGGTSQVGDWNTSTSLEDASSIFEQCCRLLPSLRDAELLEHWVGLRPGRVRVRLEAESLAGSEVGGPLPVVHNYGHGGSGLTLGWGCAGDAVALLRSSLGV